MTRVLAPALFVAALALVGCGGGTDDPAPASTPAPSAAAPAPVEAADLSTVGGQLEEAWGTSCGEELVDMAGYTKRVCAIPDDLMAPGMESNAVGLHAYSDASQVEAYRASYLGEGVLVVGEGWFIHAPTERVAASAEQALQG